MKEISATDPKQRLDRGEDIQIIDVREPNEYEVALGMPTDQNLSKMDGSKLMESSR